jgi:hypothetical protein
MSIRNLNSDNNKEWLKIKSNTYNSSQINVTSTMNVPVGGIVRLQSLDGTDGQVLKKDGSNNLSWDSSTIFGSTITTQAQYTGIPSITASAVWFIIPGGDFFAPAQAGTYLFIYSGEIRNQTANGGVAMKIEQQVPLTDINEWSMDTTSGNVDWHSCVGFKILTLAGSEVFKWYHKTDGTGSAESSNLRGVFYRLS